MVLSFLETGVPNGWSDSYYHLTKMVLYFSFVETKIAPRRPTKEQIEFINPYNVKQKIVAGVAYT